MYAECPGALCRSEWLWVVCTWEIQAFANVSVVPICELVLQIWKQSQWEAFEAWTEKPLVEDFYAFVWRIYHANPSELSKTNRCCTICFLWVLQLPCCLAAHVICSAAFPPCTLWCVYSYFVGMQVAQSTFFIFILGDLYLSVSLCVCVPLCDACVRACLRFIRLLTICNITNGAEVTAFVHHYIATIFASCVCVCV